MDPSPGDSPGEGFWGAAVLTFPLTSTGTSFLFHVTYCALKRDCSGFAAAFLEFHDNEIIGRDTQNGSKNTLKMVVCPL